MSDIKKTGIGSKLSSRRVLACALGIGATRVAALLNTILLVSVIGIIFVNALPALSWSFVFDAPRNMMSEGGVWPAIVGTVLLSLGALAVALPLGVASAVYLKEFGRETQFSSWVRIAIANLAGVPSIIFGLFGLSFFVVFCGLGVSLLSGILTLAVLSLPIVITTTEAALIQVPQEWREASLALGATRRQTILKVVLPAAMPGILTGSILALSRAAGETAAIMFTAAVFFTPKNVGSLLDPVMALPNHMYVLATSGTQIEATRPMQYGTGLLLLGLVILLNFAVIVIRDRARSRS